jgi:hypothetical protein
VGVVSTLAYLMNDPTPVRRVLREAIARTGLGSFEFRYRIGALRKMSYAYIIYQAALLAKRLGEPRISVLEFGVAGGNGLVWMERHAEQVEKLFGVKIDIYGFDTGEGLPAPIDYRDLSYHWKPGFFKMDQDALKKRLKRSTLVLGNVEDTCKTFFEDYNPAPIAAVSHDLDFYSSTMSGLRLFEGAEGRMLPRVLCYFDDVIGGDIELYSDFVGERLAIHDFNAAHADRKIADPYHLRGAKSFGHWQFNIWVLHLFGHAKYNAFVSDENQQLPLNG